MNTARFHGWVRRHLVRHLRRGDVVVMDNLAAHKARPVRELIEQSGATVRFLPPYSYDFNPIEAAWALIKKRIRAVAPGPGPRSAAPRSALGGSSSLATATRGSLMLVTNSSDPWRSMGLESIRPVSI